MYQSRDRETVNMILQNPNLWNESMITETLRRFKKDNSYADCDFNPHDVQKLIENYLFTLWDAMKKTKPVKKERKNEDSSSSQFSLSEYDLNYVEDNMMGIAWCNIVFK